MSYNIKKFRNRFRRYTTYLINCVLRRYYGVAVFYDKSLEQENRFSLLYKIKDEHLLMRDNESLRLMALVHAVRRIPGEIAEVGSYKGRSAKIIAEIERDKLIYTFDTFEGLPSLTNKDVKAKFVRGQFSVNYSEVQSYLDKYKNISVHKGVFPNNSQVLQGKRFSFINLDVDLYEGTLESLKFFYSKINPGGVILIHDYLSKNNTSVYNAVNDFFSDKPEPILEFGDGSQCMIVKL